MRSAQAGAEAGSSTKWAAHRGWLLGAVAAVLLAVLLPLFTASPAQAATTQCGAWVPSGQTGIYLQTCATRDGIATQSRTTARNSGGMSEYVDQLQVKMSLEGSYRICTVQSWIPVGQTVSCTGDFLVTNSSTFAQGWVYYWTGSAYAWLNANSPAI